MDPPLKRRALNNNNNNIRQPKLMNGGRNGKRSELALAVSLLLLAASALPSVYAKQDKGIELSQEVPIATATNSCFETSKDAGCSDSSCQSAVCDTISSDCCEVRWDGPCVQVALDNLDFCNEDWPDQSNTCFEAEPFARGGCADATCQALVCEQDSSCCEVSFTAACVTLATQVCDTSNEFRQNSCFASSVLGGCRDATCERVVCDTSPTCCSDLYSNTCIQIARQHPDLCVPPISENECVEESNFGGCTDADCESQVCQVRPSCCNSDTTATGEWSTACVQIALETCNRPDPTNNCFETSGLPGCTDPVCLNAVCDTHKFCCDASYSSGCVELARQHPTVCLPPVQGNGCAEESPFGGCDEASCQEQVCAIRGGCCDTDTVIGEWSSSCVEIARETCVEPKQSCFERGPDGGCADPKCEAVVCNIDPFCCNRVWDNSCITKAKQNLDVCQLGYPEQDNDCFTSEPFDRPNCSDSICQAEVCDNWRPECCSEHWDQFCVDLALGKCDLPPPRNSCFEQSHTPGCDELDCRETICDVRSECCTGPFDQTCINIAKRNALTCSTPPPIHGCLEESEFGGCRESRCAELVCGIEEDCCDQGNRAGVWASICTRIADEVCEPAIKRKPPGKCPFGHTCNDEFMANCTELRDVALDVFEIGDIYAGVFCGTDDTSIQNCPAGSYCPNPETKIPCPAGFFCPHKSSAPIIICNNCEEGATKMQRDTFGYIILIIIASIAFLYIVYKLANRYNKHFLDRLHLLDRLHGFSVGGGISEFEHRIQDFKLSVGQHSKKQQQELKKVRHKVELINRRLASLAQKGDLPMKQADADYFRKQSASTDNLGEDHGHHEVTFDARRVFDALDADDSGDVSFDELNVILGLNELELSEFIRRMNELAGYKRPKNSVTRPVFVKFFLQVLRETTNLTVSFEEAGAIFDELSNSSSLNSKVDEVHMSTFYHSSMANFLSDAQICDIIKRFKVIKKMSAPAERRASSRKVGGRRTSIFSFGATSGVFSVGGNSDGGNSNNFLTNSSRHNGRSGGSGSAMGTNMASRRGSSGNALRRRSGASTGSTEIVHTRDSLMVIARAEFVEHYPQLLLEVTMDGEVSPGGMDDNLESTLDLVYPGIDITFKDLSLGIKVGDSNINVVDKVTGRIRAKTMTALMGGSGAGKTSLLNALCGRAFYGTTTGDIYVNGQETKIEDHKDAVGFVPQDDIVYAELTVRENLMFAGRFRLPKGTPEDEIQDLADETLANLGLSRVANSLVGDVRRRGVSGGEKKRVNIGLELMAAPTILFLDEPTSGLDASSALLVMKSLKHLVEKEGVTIVSVIHQPRKFIFDLFDSLILLGVGGRMVYHGAIDQSEQYFNRLHYKLPEGESVADWLIDISSGRLEPDCQVASCRKTEQIISRKSKRNLFAGGFAGVSKLDMKPSESLGDKKSTIKFAPELKEEDEKEENQRTEDEMIEKPAGQIARVSRENSLKLDDETEISEGSMEADPLSRSTTNFEFAGRCVTDDAIVGAKGVTTGKVVQAFEEAKGRRGWLYTEWETHFLRLGGEEKKLYEVPNSYALPDDVIKPSFWYQLVFQFRRACIVAYRNRFSKFIDACIIIGAIVVITALDGIAEITYDEDPDVAFEIMVRPTEDDVDDLFAGLFRYSLTRQITYPLKVGIILSTLMGLTATKVLTSKRLEFFREAGSGYNINAYFTAINVVATIEHGLQVTVAAFLAYWIRNPLASAASFWIHFFLLSWIVVGWSMLIPMIVPAESVVLVAGFFFAFCGLMFAGAFPPIIYQDIYEGGFIEVFSGWVAPTRFFYEALAVGEYRCLPEQSGFTISELAINREWNTSMLSAIGYAGHDPYAVERSCDGWYWSVLPAILIGITVRYGAALAMHGFQRAQQTKKPLTYEIRQHRGVAMQVVIYVIVLLALIGFTSWAFVRDLPYDYVELEPDLTKYFFDD